MIAGVIRWSARNLLLVLIATAAIVGGGLFAVGRLSLDALPDPEHDHDVLLVTADEGSAGLQRLAQRSLCDGLVLMDIEARDERVPVAASLSVPVILIGVPGNCLPMLTAWRT